MKPRKNPPGIDLEPADEKTVTVPSPAIAYEGEDDALERLMQEEFIKEGKTTLYRLPVDGKKRIYVTTILNSNFSTQWIAENYGGGNYEACIRDSSGAVRFREKVDIDQSVKPILTAPAGPATNGNGNHTADLAKLLSASGGGKDTMDMVKSMALIITAVTPLVTAFASRPQAAPTSVSDAILLKLLDKKDDKAELLQTLELAERLADMKNGKRSNLTDDDEEKGTLEKLVSSFGAGVASRLFGMGGAPSASEPRPANVIQIPAGTVAGKPAGPSSPAPQPPAPAADSSVNQMSILLDMLLRAAGKGGDPASYADLLEDQLDATQVDMMKTALRSPNWFTEIFPSDDPRYKAAQGWFTELRDELLSPIVDDKAT